ncbi:hypothetical protein BKE38_01345 [Pseudoroseomonas deserti]|uniref:Histidine kinase n=1 Tax=Teichococcus deserti TaxID=1817963 RepID=A0A1V2H8E0_9PROT|nr:SiaB family protein kinase [Pseudoroseomonas deserti]ONG58878.1 hypothetical protein BKE38_01345 [Pseudoroseomonas deserti]
MLAQQYTAFHQAIRENGIILSFSGFVSEKVMFSLGEVLRARMQQEETDTGIAKRVFSIFVEQAQNVIRYSANRIAKEPTPPLSAGMIIVGIEEGRFFVVCGNEVLRRDVPVLQGRLDLLAGMNAEELKAHYRVKLKEPPEEGSLGGSIGLIEIVRRASAPVEFDFQDVGADLSFFCLKAYI